MAAYHLLISSPNSDRLIGRGNADATMTWLDKAHDQNEAGLTEQFLLPFYSSIDSDPRWRAFLERVGSSPEQLNAIRFEVTLPE